MYKLISASCLQLSFVTTVISSYLYRLGMLTKFNVQYILLYKFILRGNINIGIMVLCGFFLVITLYLLFIISGNQ